MLDQLQEVKDRVDILEVISTYLTVKKAGANYKAACPFHNEKTPSLMISPERQTFKCFGCSEGGDVITFVEKIEGLDFYNALKLLAEKAGVQLKTDSVKFGNKEFKADNKTRLFEINEWAKKVYHKLLLDHPKAERARKYIDSRGMKKETISLFEIGYAPNSWDFLLRFLKSKGYTEQEAVEAGVAIKAEQGKVYDRFRGRIIFPIGNIMGNTVAFTSRILEDDGKSAKYINSAETPIYTKGKTIYGLDKAKLAIKEKDLAIMVEGNMDVIACHQAGFKNVVATSGTALTLDQLIILSRYAKTIAFCFDSDNAGQTAMKRAIRLAMQNDISIKIISTMPFKDPDEAIKESPKNWEKSVKMAKPALEYWIDQLTNKKELDVNDKKAAAKEILPVIKIIFSDIEKEHYIKYLSEKLSISEKSLIDALEKSKKDTEFTKSMKENTSVPEKKMTVEERIIGLIWAEPELCQKLQKVSAQFVNFPKELAPITDMIKTGCIEREKIKPELAAVYDQLSISALQNVNSEEEGAIQEEIEYLLGRLRSDQLETIKEQFAKKIKEAEAKGDKEGLKKLLCEFSSLIK
jgi:DNA primase